MSIIVIIITVFNFIHVVQHATHCMEQFILVMSHLSDHGSLSRGACEGQFQSIEKELWNTDQLCSHANESWGYHIVHEKCTIVWDEDAPAKIINITASALKSPSNKY